MNEWVAEDLPEVVGFEEDPIILPNGLKKGENILRKVEMSEMLGEDEELFGSVKFKNNPGRVLSEILSKRVLSIDEEIPNIEDIRDLLVGDREYLLLKFRQISLGDEVTFEVVCPNRNCSHKSRKTFLISSIPIIYGTGERILEDIELKTGYKDKQGTVHDKVTIRMANGKDQELLTVELRRNLFEAMSVQLGEAIVKLGTLDDKTLNRLRNEIPKKLSKRDREIIDDKIFEAHRGPDSIISCTCVNCNLDFEVPFPFESFFVKKPRKSRRVQI